VLASEEVFRCLVFKDAALRFIQCVFGENAVLIASCEGSEIAGSAPCRFCMK